ncbi:J domain-containing protein [bacterium]|nr:J domain-containing protein [bacterium]
MSEKSFEQVLRSQLDQGRGEHQWNFNSQSYSGSDACLEFLCAASEVKLRFGRRIKEMFVSKTGEAVKPAPQDVKPPNSTTSVSEEPALKMESLDFAALGAVELFRRQGEVLTFPLSEAQLKSCWRRLAKKTHPDLVSKESRSEVLDFQITRDAYKLLQGFFKQAA